MSKNTEENIISFQSSDFLEKPTYFLGSQIMYTLNNVSLLAYALTFRVNSKWNISIFSRESHCRRADLERGLLNFHHSSAIPSQTQLVESFFEVVSKFFFNFRFDKIFQWKMNLQVFHGNVGFYTFKCDFLNMLTQLCKALV